MDLHRELVGLNRDAYLPDLAISVNNLAMRLGEAGRRAEGLTAAQEAVDLHRELVSSTATPTCPDLARSVTNLGVRLAEAGRRRPAHPSRRRELGRRGAGRLGASRRAERPAARPSRAADGPPGGVDVELVSAGAEATLGAAVAVAGMPTGFLAVWSEEDRDGPFISDRRLVARTVSPDGALGPVARIAALENGSSEDLDVAVDAAGMGVAVWAGLDRGDEIPCVLQASTRAREPSAPPSTSIRRAVRSRHCCRYSRTVSDRMAERAGARARVLTLCGESHPQPGEACDDGNRRDGDCCAAACRLEPMPGTCWRLAGS